MHFNWQLKFMPPPSLLLFITTVAISLTSACSVPIKDAQFCAPIPFTGGAVCDYMLHKDQKILSQHEWNTLQGEWVNEGSPAVCTQAKTVGDLKAELEKLCSTTHCSYEVIKPALEALDKIQTMAGAK